MSAIEESKSEIRVKPAAQVKATPSLLTRFLNLLSSVRFGVTLLVLLAAASMVGMLVEQQNVEGFDKYFIQLAPSTRLLFGSLGFFDIYHSWYFNALLLVLSLNIVLASIDRFPKAWTFISRKKLDASATWLKGQTTSATLELTGADRSAVANRVAEACRRAGLKPTITEKGKRTFIFAERGAWNRLGAYAVHVALLTIFFGGFMTAQFGRTGQMPLKPGTSANEMSEVVFNLDQPAKQSVSLPFDVTCEDIQQTLIKKDGPITADNTIDWFTKIKIKDETGTHDALVHLNRPFDYRGYRFFQASFINVGRARNITLRLTPQDGGQPVEVSIPRDGSTTLADGTKINFVNFQPDFRLAGGDATTESGEYNNPAALLTVTTPSGEPKKAYAFAQDLPSGAPIGAPVAGYKFRLMDFEKVPDAHILSIQKDPGSSIFYTGGAMLFFALGSVFFFSHQRVWALIEERGDKTFEVVLGANTNRNIVALEDRFKRVVNAINGQTNEVSS